MQKIGIGYENYKEFVEGNLYYVDKTMLVRDLVEKGGKVKRRKGNLIYPAKKIWQDARTFHASDFF